MGERIYLDEEKKAEMVKLLHKETQLQIEKKNEAYAKAANKRRKQVLFKLEDLVWIHLRKERFPNQRKSKLMPRADGPFRILEKINHNAYKLDLPSTYNVSTTFNVRDLTPYLEDTVNAEESADLRPNPLQQREDDVPWTENSRLQLDEVQPSNLKEEEADTVTYFKAKRVNLLKGSISQEIT